MNSGLRYTLHDQLVSDLQAHTKDIGINDIVSLDFRQSSHWDILPTQTIYGAPLSPIQNIDVKVDHGTIFSGHMLFIYDDLADSLHIWWTQEDTLDIPDHIWHQLDLGVRRRLITHPHWQHTVAVRSYAASRHERVTL